MNRNSAICVMLGALVLGGCGEQVRVTTDDRAEAVEMLAKQSSGAAPKGYVALTEAAGMG